MARWTPMRWPTTWQDPATVSLLKGTAINYLLVEKGDALAAVRSRARQEAIEVAETGAMIPGVSILKGEWPGVRMSRGRSDPTAGPTGVPWVDTNGWRARLSSVMNPQAAVWIDAAPKDNTRLTPEAYGIALADSAAYGGRWIIALDTQFAAGIKDQKPDALTAWKNITTAAGFFATRTAGADFVPQAVVGVISDFTGRNEFFTREVVNLLGRAGQQYRIILKDRISETSFQSLRAVIYADATEPAPALRKQILGFVQSGGMLITGPKWGELAGTPAKVEEHPRFATRTLGKGKIAVANSNPDDPYMLANDSVILISHRHDLVRLWNAGAYGSYFVASPDRKRAVVHLVFYSNRGPDAAAVRVAGPYRTAKISTVEQPEPRAVEFELHKDAIEIHLPPVSQYVAVDLAV